MSDEKREKGKQFLEKYSINASNSVNERNLNKAVLNLQESINESTDDKSKYESSKLLQETFEKLNSLLPKDKINNPDNFPKYIYYNNMLMKILSNNIRYSKDFDDGNEESYIILAKKIINELPLENIGENPYEMIENFLCFPDIYYELIGVLMKTYLNEGIKIYNSNNLPKAKNTFYTITDIDIRYKLNEIIDKLEINKEIKNEIKEVMYEGKFYYDKINCEFEINKGFNALKEYEEDEDDDDKKVDATNALTSFRNAYKEIEKMKKKDNKLEAICLSNISIIMWKIFGYNNTNRMNQIKQYVETAINYVRNNNPPDLTYEKWYIESCNILKDINERLQMRDDFEKDDPDKILKELNDRANDSHIDFIKFVLDKYPYKGYKKTDDIETKFKKNPLSYIRSLVVKYHPDRYPKNTEEDKKKFVIIHEISAILNNIYVFYDEKNK